MYEQFTDRSRQVMQIANQEAQRFNHEYIGTEHILLGLIKEGSGVASAVLKQLQVDLRNVRLEVEKLVQSGPDMTMGKLPQTPRAKKVIEYAMEEAKALDHNYVGTEHLLLGVIRVKEGIASEVLANLGVTVERIRKECLNLLGCGEGPLDTPRSKIRELGIKTGEHYAKLREDIVCIILADLSTNQPATHTINQITDRLGKFNTN